MIDNSYSMCMKTFLVSIFVIAAWLAPVASEAYACTVCHSKNPRMVRMHEELGFKDCFKCHGQGMGKTPEERKAQMTEDERCIPCHKK